MIEFQGIYFDGRSSRPYPARFVCDKRKFVVQGKYISFYREFPLSGCRIDPPLGSTSRSIRLPGGAVCETEESDAVSAIESLAGRNRGMQFVHLIESRWKTAVLSLAGLIVFLWLFKVYAIPYIAKEAAYAAPLAVSEELSHQTMKILDKRFLKPSLLTSERASKLREAFHNLLDDIDREDFNYRLEFRNSPIMGPNAFALPSGQIVMTDELVKLSENERELEGILLHEIGHVHMRHGLRMVIQNAGLFLVIAALLGDLTEISSTAASLPTILARSEYSREFERMADRFAAGFFVNKGWDIKPMQEILGRITKDLPNFPGESVLSTHPVVQERIKYLETEVREPAYRTGRQESAKNVQD
jgi:Zn-dependent protease with chaperone function